jgi:FkbM family methyltransferase
MKLEETLKGGYSGLYGEVVKSDCYKLMELNFDPDIIFDIGANIGIFARYARELYPKAKIICLEPDPQNCSVFREHTRDKNIILIEKALGHGPIYHATTAANGSGECYHSAGLGYPKKLLEQAVEDGAAMERSEVKSIRLWELVTDFAKEGKSHILKLDCEGAENTIWGHPVSMCALKMMDYIAAEVHFYGHNAEEAAEVREKTMEAIRDLGETHNYKLDNVHLWALRKGL